LAVEQSSKHLLRGLNNFLGPILVVVFFAVMVLTPLIILVLGIMNFRSDSLRQTRNALQALAAIVIWSVLTFIIVMICFMTVFQFPAYKSQSDEIISTAIFFGGGLIYILVGGVLIYWTRRQKRRMPGMGVSC
jgi:hypothetical protein